MIAEMPIGRRTGKSGFSAFGGIDKKWRFVGILTTIAPLIIL